MRTGDIQPIIVRTQELEKVKEVQRQTSETVQKQFQMYFRQITEQKQSEIENSKESYKSKGVDERERKEERFRERQTRRGNRSKDGSTEDLSQPGIGENIDIKI
ncbi:MAG: hypothetical protein N2380_07810 [bacterium]|nr:hypothetical protein [bacterium]